MSRWVAISTDFIDDPDFAETPLSEREAFLWLISKASWKDTTHRVGNERQAVPRGSLFVTLRQLQTAWKWASDKRVRGFLQMLENGRKIERVTDAGKTLITICKYDKYQSFGRSEDAEETQDRTQPGRNEDALKTPVYQDTKEGSFVQPAPPPSPRKPKLKDEDFERFKRAYPRRHVQIPWQPARKKMARFVEQGIDPETIIAGAAGYAAEMAKVGRTGTEFVKMADSFLNSELWREYSQGPPADFKPTFSFPKVDVAALERQYRDEGLIQ